MADTPLVDPASTAQVVQAILDDCLYNIISDTVLKAHREEKMSRMQSAAILAQQAKDKAKAEASPGGEPQTITTAGATINEEDKIYLHGNPLTTTSEIICPVCRLPRLNHPTTGKYSQPPSSSREYCAKQPYIDKEGCDIYGKSLVLEKPSKKKAAAAAAASSKSKPNTDSRSGSESPGGSPPNGNKPNPSSSSADKPAASSIPSGKCPNCPRYLAFTRMAQHMDRCIGISGRQSSKNALTKLSSGTPREASRASTPKPGTASAGAGASAATTSGSQAAVTAGSGGPGASSQGSATGGGTKKRKLDRGSDEEDEGERTTPVKKKKVGKKEGKVKAVNAIVARVKGAEKRLPGQGDAGAPSSSSSAAAGAGEAAKTEKGDGDTKSSADSAE